MNIIYDEMDNEDKRLRPCCNEWVDRYDEWDKDIDCCKWCAENDTNYRDYINRRNAKEDYAELRRDILMDEVY